MRGDPADPLTAARSLRDFSSWIIMLYNHSRGLQQTIMADIPVVICDSLSYCYAYCLVTACSRCVYWCWVNVKPAVVQWG